MKSLFLLLAALALAAPSLAAKSAPVQIKLHDTASVQPDADGFFTLGMIADLSGGSQAARDKVAAVSIGRAPIPGDSRTLARGDVTLKLRQAGFDPDRQTALQGADTVVITSSSPAPPALGAGARATPPVLGAGGPGTAQPAILVHRGDPVTIIMQDGNVTITATGVACDAGASGENIRVRREGAMTSLNVKVLDAQTVQLEI